MSGRRVEPGEGRGEAGSPSQRTAIVGGRPARPRADLPPVPTGIQRLLYLAASNAVFRQALLAGRADAAVAAGVDLTPSERAVLASIPAEQLARMAESLPPPSPQRREFLRQTAATAAVLLGGAAPDEPL